MDKTNWSPSNKYSVFPQTLMTMVESHFRPPCSNNPIYFHCFLKAYWSERTAQAWSDIFVSECFLFSLQADPLLSRRHTEGANWLIERIQSLSPLNCWVTLQRCQYKLHFTTALLLSVSLVERSSHSCSLNMKSNRAIHPTEEFIFPITQALCRMGKLTAASWDFLPLMALEEIQRAPGGRAHLWGFNCNAFWPKLWSFCGSTSVRWWMWATWISCGFILCTPLGLAANALLAHPCKGGLRASERESVPWERRPSISAHNCNC